MADTVAPMITDAVTSDAPRTPRGVGEERYVVRSDAGGVALVWCADTDTVAFEVRFVGSELALPVRVGAGAAVTTDLSLEIELGPGAAGHELASWITARLEPDAPEPDAPEPSSPCRFGTVSFGVSSERGRVTLAWDPKAARAYYSVLARDVTVRVPAQVERTPGRASVDARVTVPLANPEVARDLAHWIRATIPNDDAPSEDAPDADES